MILDITSAQEFFHYPLRRSKCKHSGVAIPEKRNHLLRCSVCGGGGGYIRHIPPANPKTLTAVLHIIIASLYRKRPPRPWSEEEIKYVDNISVMYNLAFVHIVMLTWVIMMSMGWVGF